MFIDLSGYEIKADKIKSENQYKWFKAKSEIKKLTEQGIGLGTRVSDKTNRQKIFW